MSDRDQEIRHAQEAARYRDTLILQKINATHRVAFAEKFPGQCEHLLRLIAERLQTGLDKRDGVVLDDPATWRLSPESIMQLSQALHSVYQVHRELQTHVKSRNINE